VRVRAEQADVDYGYVAGVTTTEARRVVSANRGWGHSCQLKTGPLSSGRLLSSRRSFIVDTGCSRIHRREQVRRRRRSPGHSRAHL
jgi:hypothetical protein